jgi:EpsI family protein
MRARVLIALALVAGAVVLTHGARGTSPMSAIQLDALPLAMGAWRGADAGGLDEETRRILAADTYVNRSYVGEASSPIGMYAAYYAQQKPGVSIHSPLHCLPGTGWEPLNVATRTLDGQSVRRLVVRKERERQVVLYWYAVHGRTVGNEVASKLWLLHDSLRFGRSDAALIRVSIPVADSVDAAERSGLAFARALLPYVSNLWS